jgi:hypothetical protein
MSTHLQALQIRTILHRMVNRLNTLLPLAVAASCLSASTCPYQGGETALWAFFIPVTFVLCIICTIDMMPHALWDTPQVLDYKYRVEMKRLAEKLKQASEQPEEEPEPSWGSGSEWDFD